MINYTSFYNYKDEDLLFFHEQLRYGLLGIQLFHLCPSNN